ncbi:MAG: transglutaminase-like domain-containing protein, partial [Nanoarchaeota archaeon]|nr:transglutaminase-like domain-containing protein [Nanoarchaeota archaeon]
NTKPEYDFFSEGDKIFLFKWDSYSNSKISFELDTDILIKNDFPKIRNTVSFPLSGIPEGIKEDYTVGTEKLDINEFIKAKSNELAAGETDLFVVSYKIADWVKNNIKYDLNTLTADADQKSSWVFANKQGVCDEITNLFISMLRSVKIPARFVSGIVYSNIDNSFGNHGWAEVYFPGYGWIPFDVTFGQYGWIDPTHLKLDDSADSGVPSVEYHWSSRELEIKAEALDFKTDIVSKDGRLTPYVDIAIRPLKEKVKFGSYVPVEVSVENLKDYYLPMSIHITKAPELIKKANGAYFVMKPKGKKYFYWLVKIPADLEEDYIYTSELAVKTVFGNIASNTIKYADTFEFYSEIWAEALMGDLVERETKFFFSNLDISCESDKDTYYSIEDANIVCLIKNAGNVQLDEVRTCLADNCGKIALSIGEEKELTFKKDLVKTETVIISAENEDMVRYFNLQLNVVEVPDLQVSGIQPTDIGYYESDNLLISLVTDSPAYNVKVRVEGLGVAEWEKIQDKSIMKIPFEGSSVSDGIIDVKMSYEDELGKVYTKDLELSITVNNIPSYAKFFNWLKNLFRS